MIKDASPDERRAVEEWIQKIQDYDSDTLELILKQLEYKLDSYLEGVDSITSKLISLNSMCLVLSVALIGVFTSLLLSNLFSGNGGITWISLPITGFWFLVLSAYTTYIVRPQRIHSMGEGWRYYDENPEWSMEWEPKYRLLYLISRYALKVEDTEQKSQSYARQYYLISSGAGIASLILLVIAICEWMQ